MYRMGGLPKYNLGTGEGTICSSEGQVDVWLGRQTALYLLHSGATPGGSRGRPPPSPRQSPRPWCQYSLL
jgi:hypothetical protein